MRRTVTTPPLGVDQPRGQAERLEPPRRGRAAHDRGGARRVGVDARGRGDADGPPRPARPARRWPGRRCGGRPRRRVASGAPWCSTWPAPPPIDGHALAVGLGPARWSSVTRDRPSRRPGRAGRRRRRHRGRRAWASRRPRRCARAARSAARALAVAPRSSRHPRVIRSTPRRASSVTPRQPAAGIPRTSSAASASDRREVAVVAQGDERRGDRGVDRAIGLLRGPQRDAAPPR